jgi:DtxR family Mn-dependent transcriptional regulator
VDPLISLAALGALVVVVAAVFWPRTGVWWRVASNLRRGERVFVEDSLKHIHDCEYRGVSCTVASLAGAVGVSINKAVSVVARLDELGLARAESRSKVTLTEQGSGYALRVIRIHRLWESYLSSETGLTPPEWHVEADRREHGTSVEEADALSARLGHPRFDPHGDPIPTASGELAPQVGVALASVAVGGFGEVVHIEDKPESVYADLIARGFHLGMRLKVSGSADGTTTVRSSSGEVALGSMAATSVRVRPLRVPEHSKVDLLVAPLRLSDLAVGQCATVVEISRSIRGAPRRRLLDLGVLPGTLVTATLRSPSGDPTAYRIRGATIALRSDQADFIEVAPGECGGER